MSESSLLIRVQRKLIQRFDRFVSPLGQQRNGREFFSRKFVMPHIFRKKRFSFRSYFAKRLRKDDARMIQDALHHTSPIMKQTIVVQKGAREAASRVFSFEIVNQPQQ
ncbi:MAG: hypothetical protein APF80_14980 [Alphaproteobacteria bacterium BRH_c36]|nr:MAG: hypothetical protein APF80_14980 [Alphaproteobacteria bacterium BRH_c36]